MARSGQVQAPLAGYLSGVHETDTLTSGRRGHSDRLPRLAAVLRSILELFKPTDDPPASWEMRQWR